MTAGLADLAAGDKTERALSVAMAAPRLRALGYDVSAGGGERPSNGLYEPLSHSGGSMHSRFDALVGPIVSFARAAENAATR